jgi:cytochrome d ubiquinol oxidase subunit I
MLIAAYLTGAFCVAATGAWYRLRNLYAVEARTMLGMGLSLASAIVPVQMLFGHLNGDYVHERQPAKFAAIEGRWHDERPAGEVLFAIPDPASGTNHAELRIPYLGSLIATMRLDSKEVGLADFPAGDRPPVTIPFFAFRIMVGSGLLMLAVAWVGLATYARGSLEDSRRLLWAVFLCFPLPFIATLTGWFTAEVGRQPWTVYGLLRTAESVTPGLTANAALASLLFFGAIYTFIFGFGTLFIYRLLAAGPAAAPSGRPENAKRPLAVPGVAPAILDDGR